MLAPVRWIIALVTALAGLLGGGKEEPKAVAATPQAVSLKAEHVMVSGTMVDGRGGRWVCRAPEPPVPLEARVLKIGRDLPARPLISGRG